MDPRWYAIQTKPRQEERVSLRLQAFSHLSVFLPRIAVPKRRGERRIMTVEMMFPSYLFVRMALDPGPWYGVRWTPGVKRIVGTGDVPIPVPDEAMRLLMDRCGTEGVMTWRPPLTVGSNVRVLHGPFAGLIGVLERPSSRQERVRVLLHLLGGPTPVEVDIADIEKVS